jgi:hypothetical protein
MKKLVQWEDDSTDMGGGVAKIWNATPHDPKATKWRDHRGGIRWEMC